MDFKQAYSKYFLQASVLQKLIVANLVVFVFVNLIIGLGALFNYNLLFINNWLVFPNDIFDYISKPWTIITYAFMHNGFLHLFFNMLWLYFFGQIFLNIHTGRRFLNVYFLGAIFGALLYMVAYSFFPAFAQISNGNLRGASAAVSAIMVAATVQSPESPLRFMFIPFTFKLWWITVGLLIFYVIGINPNSGNAGGNFSHLGGAIIGYIYMKQLQKGNDLGTPIEKTMDWVVNIFKSSDKPKLKTVHKTKKTKSKVVRSTKNTNTQQQIDAILDKISKSGYESLSKKEKDFLFKAGKQ